MACKTKKKLKLGGFLGDVGRLYADSVLSTFGAQDVIKDNAYNGDFFKKASKVTAPIAQGVGMIGANMLAPGVGGAALGSLQQGVGSAVGPDNSMMNTPQQQKIQQPMNQISYAPTFENGGNMNIQQYGGNTHAQGGIGVDKQGNPSSVSKLPTIAEVEDKEYAMDGYVFSAKLKPDKKNKSFADEFKHTAKKYGYDFKSKGFKRPNDKITQEEFKDVIGQLKAKQDTTKVKKGLAHVMPDGTVMDGKPMMAMGGKLPKAQYGLNLGDPPYKEQSLLATGVDTNNLYTKNYPFNSPTSNFGDIFNTTQVQAPNTSIQKPLLIPLKTNQNTLIDSPSTNFGDVFNAKQAYVPNTSIQKQQLDFGNVMPNEYAPRDLKGANEPGYTPDSTTTTSVTPQGNNLSNIGMGIQAGASALNAIRAFREKPQLTKPQQIQPQQIDLSNQRLAAKNQADLARSVAARNAGISGTTSGFLGNTRAANAGIQRGLGEQLGQSYMNEESANAQAREQADMFNAQSRAQADQANIAERDAITNLRSAGIAGLGQTAGSISRDLLGYKAEAAKASWLGTPNFKSIKINGKLTKLSESTWTTPKGTKALYDGVTDKFYDSTGKEYKESELNKD